MKRKVQGVGINDAGYPVSWKDTQGKHKLCPFYSTWSHMLERCYSKREHNRHPTYIGCSVCEEWHLFSNFKRWMEQQDWEGKQLDKDLLVSGNKIYSPETCVFIDGTLNACIANNSKNRGCLPLGVWYKLPSKRMTSERSKPYIAETIVGGLNVKLGQYTTAQEAHKVWQIYKQEELLQYCDNQNNERVKFRLQEFSDKILLDCLEGVETRGYL